MTPGKILERPATWKHRVVLAKDINDQNKLQECWSLVIHGAKERHWGFWCKDGWKPWREYLARAEANNGKGCD